MCEQHDRDHGVPVALRAQLQGAEAVSNRTMIEVSMTRLAVTALTPLDLE